MKSVSCKDNPCSNKGYCVSLLYHNDICVCESGYGGKYCELTIVKNECPKICETKINNGKCDEICYNSACYFEIEECNALELSEDYNLNYPYIMDKVNVYNSWDKPYLIVLNIDIEPRFFTVDVAERVLKNLRSLTKTLVVYEVNDEGELEIYPYHKKLNIFGRFNASATHKNSDTFMMNDYNPHNVYSMIIVIKIDYDGCDDYYGCQFQDDNELLKYLKTVDLKEIVPTKDSGDDIFSFLAIIMVLIMFCCLVAISDDGEKVFDDKKKKDFILDMKPNDIFDDKKKKDFILDMERIIRL